MLIDSTLREGDQRFGAYFDADAKHAILDRIAAVGVEEIEAGCAGRCPDTPGLVITSYSIHYTKLYEALAVSLVEDRVQDLLHEPHRNNFV